MDEDTLSVTIAQAMADFTLCAAAPGMAMTDFIAARIISLISAARQQETVISDEVVERMCAAYVDASFDGADFWSRLTDEHHAECRKAMRAALSLLPRGDLASVAKSAAGDASHLTASETPCKSEWPNPACPCTDPLWCIQRELCKRTAQEPPSPTPCDLEGK